MQPMQSQAPAPAQAAQAGQFGPLIEEFTASTLANTIYGLVLLVFAAGGLALFISDKSNNLIFAVIGLIFLIIAAYLLVTSALNSRNKVQVFRDGLVVVRGAQSQAIPWNAITAFYQRIVRTRQSFVITSMSYRFTIELADGKRYVFSQYKNVGRLGEILRQETTARQLPGARAAYQAGQTLTFGKMSLSQVGLSNGRETIPWGEVSGIQVANGAIIISRQGKRLAWASPLVPNVPNFVVFVTLAQEHAGAR
ncbi:MAG TPA: DUF6585 family protein [Ktedonobacterales bacterium]|nr:DUF6585 family protein [Ktedonobacterales bacterium]